MICMSRAIVAWTCVVLVAAACGTVPAMNPAAASPSSAAAATANVSGTVDRGAMATCPADEPCDPPMVAYRLVFSRPGLPDVTARVNGNGTFALHLDPGVYTIAAEPPSFQGKLDPSVVNVPQDGTVHLDLHIVRSA
jgi:hypothetical protein